jgi:predicted nucleic acid-binding Zn ribbon protein
MFDLETIDRMFEAGRPSGTQIQFRIFDKSVLLPLPQLLDAASHAAGQTLSETELRFMAGQGWLPLLPGAGVDENEEGAPIYVPDRIGVFMRLQRQGYMTDELRVVADFEEFMIDNILTTQDLAYVDDDLETLLLHAQARIDSLEHGTTLDSNGVPIDRTAEIERARREVKYLQSLQGNGVPERLQERIEKQAFRVRAINEMTRVLLFEMDRSKIAAEYSPLVVCAGGSWSLAGGYSASAINWEMTVKSAMAYGDASDINPIRVPMFLLRGDRVLPTRTLRPAEYAQRWRELDLDAYLECWIRLRGERRCLNCLGALPEASDERKRFCSEKCRNAAKQRRHRERNPDSVERAQQRYWQSLDS